MEKLLNAAVLREIREETGLIAEIVRCLGWRVQDIRRIGQVRGSTSCTRPGSLAGTCPVLTRDPRTTTLWRSFPGSSRLIVWEAIRAIRLFLESGIARPFGRHLALARRLGRDGYARPGRHLSSITCRQLLDLGGSTRLVAYVHSPDKGRSHVDARTLTFALIVVALTGGATPRARARQRPSIRHFASVRSGSDDLAPRQRPVHKGPCR